MSKYITNHNKLYSLLVTICAVALLILGPVVGISLWKGQQKVAASWYGDSWGFRKKLTIDHNKVGGSADLTNFPILVSLTDSAITSKSQSTGNDIVFTSSDGATKLDHELEKFDAATGQIVAWVRIPTLHYQTDDVIYLYYGNSSVASQQNKTGVWDANYVAVYHLSETTGHHLDSKNSNNSTSETSLVKQGTATGMAGGADEFNGSSSVVNLPVMALTGNEGSIEAWVKSDVTTASHYALGRYFEQAALALDNSTLWRTNIAPGGGAWSGANVNTNWHYLAGTYDSALGSNTTILFLDGTASVNYGSGTGAVINENQVWQIGSNGNSNEYWDGLVDEVRLSTTPRSAGWLATTYNTISNNAAFFSAKGTEEKSRVPVVNYSFDEGYGTTVNNTGANSIPGTITNATWASEDMCVSGKCLLYNGTNAYVGVGATVSNIQTISFWVKPKTNGESIVDLDGGSHKIAASAGTITATGFTTLYVNGLVSSTLTANVWQHIEATTATPFTASVISIGKISSTYLSGFIDEFKLYDYARTVAQVKTDVVRNGAPPGSAAVFGSQSTDALNQGLVGYWKMDEAAGTSAIDSSGNGNNGTLTNGPVYTGGKFGSAVSFDGGSTADDNITISDSPSLGFSNTMTISAWIYPKGWGEASSGRIISNNNSYEFFVDNTSNYGLGFYPDGTHKINSNINAIPAFNTWYHVAISFDYTRNTYTFYVNGIPWGTGQTPYAITTSADNTQIGDINGARTFDGYLDDVRLYNRALSGNEVSQLYNWAPGPVGEWKMDENSGPVAKDTSGNNQTMTRSGNVVWTAGKYGSALKYPGENQNYLSETDATNSPLDITDAITVEAWINPAATMNNYMRIADKDYRTAWSFSSRGTDNNLSVWMNNGERAYTADNIIKVGQWQHVAFTYNKNDTGTSQVIIYLNGQLAASGNYTTAIGTNDNGLFIGTNYVGNSVFNGEIDDFRIYNYARTSKQIIEDMNGGHPAPGSPVGSAAGYWSFDEGYGTTAHNTGTLGTAVDGAFGGGNHSPNWTSDGKIGTALNFEDDAVNQKYVDVSNSAWNLKTTEDMTVSAWIKLKGNNLGTYANIWGDVDGPCFQMHLQSPGNYTLNWYTLNEYQSNTLNFTMDRWYHIAVVKQGTSGVTWYRDGIEVGRQTGLTESDETPDAVRIGSDTSGEQFNGVIDEVKVHRSALTRDQILMDYNQGKATVMGALSNTSNLSGGSVASSSASAAYCVPGSDDPCSSPIVAWNLDENQGIAVHDSSGHGYEAQANQPGVWKPGKFGSTIELPTTDYVYSTSAVKELLGASKFTISSWIKINSFTPWATIFDKWYSANDSFYIGFGGSVGVIGLDINNNPPGNGYGITSGAFTIGEWFHLTVEYNGSGATNADKIKIFVNGKAQSLSYSGTIPPTTGTGADGFKITLGQGFVVDDVRVYDYNRTPAQIAWDYNRGAPVAQYDFDECEGTTLHDTALKADKKTSGLNATASFGAVSQTQAGDCTTNDDTMWYNGRSGKYSASVKLDGSDDIITVPDNDAFSFVNGTTDQPFSLSAWIKPSGAANGAIIAKYDNTPATSKREYILYRGGSGEPTFIIEDSSTAGYIGRTSSALTPSGSWYHLVATYDGTGTAGGIKIYLNGVRVDNANFNSGSYSHMYNTDSVFMLGHNIDSSGTHANHFWGLLDDSRVYNYALTAVQVQSLYNNSSAVLFGQ